MFAVYLWRSEGGSQRNDAPFRSCKNAAQAYAILEARGISRICGTRSLRWRQLQIEMQCWSKELENKVIRLKTASICCLQRDAGKRAKHFRACTVLHASPDVSCGQLPKQKEVSTVVSGQQAAGSRLSQTREAQGRTGQKVSCHVGSSQVYEARRCLGWYAGMEEVDKLEEGVSSQE